MPTHKAKQKSDNRASQSIDFCYVAT